MTQSEFSRDILKIPIGSMVQIFELERQFSIYKESLEYYNYIEGRNKVVRS